MVPLILEIFAFVFFAIAAVGVPNIPPRFNLIAAGLAFWILAVIWPALR